MSKLKRTFKTELEELMKACKWDPKGMELDDHGVADEGEAFIIWNRYVIRRYVENEKTMYLLSVINVIPGGYMDPPEEDWEDILTGTLKQVFTKFAEVHCQEEINHHLSIIAMHEEDMEIQESEREANQQKEKCDE